MKKLSKLLLLISVFILGISVSVFAKEDLYLVVDGQKVETDAACFIEKDRTLVPIRFISEALGSKVYWDNEAKKVTITSQDESQKIDLFINSVNAKINENNEIKDVTLDVPAKIVNSRTFVPVRFISETLGVEVNWDNDNKVVIIGDIKKYNKDEFTKLRQEESFKKAEVKKETVEIEGGYISPISGNCLYIIKNDEGPNIYTATLLVYNPQTFQDQVMGRANLTLLADGKTATWQNEEDTRVFFDAKGIRIKNDISKPDGDWNIRMKENASYSVKDGKVYEDGKMIYDNGKFI
ncbi:copper amine oxidase N-terminal domain-containing protein [Peptoniphilus harei]|uniref:copper amine oxidase N-terminal domain-containing protein n=1 Tax=Peptoniphilus harei TaxID=54005 RepID=UPI0029124431|nr:copper amine oxidase N-terminal domain-containing protein [Peptoniphilus harei]MDU5418437.1 copper amine oxidase N-terminal domain-containing protein [Peptoniphilus harei]